MKDKNRENSSEISSQDSNDLDSELS